VPPQPALNQIAGCRRGGWVGTGHCCGLYRLVRAFSLADPREPAPLPAPAPGQPFSGKDYRLGPCYPAPTGHPGTGGADEHLPATARIHRYARRRGGMAARGARADQASSELILGNTDFGLRRLGLVTAKPDGWEATR
jgi:hypothetical protein